MDVSKHIKKHSVHIIALLLLLVFGGSVVIGWFLNMDTPLRYFDNYFYEAIALGPHSRWFDFLVGPFNFNFLPPQYSPGMMPSYYYFMFLGSAIYIGIFKRSKLGWFLFCVAMGTILAQIVTAIDWIYVFRERPFLSLQSNVDSIGRSAWEKLSSYPSGHARETTMYSVLIWNFIPGLKWILAVFVIFIAFSRVYVGAHYPTDVLGGMFIGFVTAKVVLIIAREMQIIFGKKKGMEDGKKPV